MIYATVVFFFLSIMGAILVLRTKKPWHYKAFLIYVLIGLTSAPIIIETRLFGYAGNTDISLPACILAAVAFLVLIGAFILSE